MTNPPGERRVLLNDFAAQWREVGPDVHAAVERVGASGWYVLGEETRRFERRLGEAWGLPFVVGVASGMDALEIALRCLGLSAGEKVLTTPLSAFATTLAAMRGGAVPVFVDTDETGLMDLSLAREALRADPSIRFLVPVHLYGHSLDLAELESLAGEFGVAVVEDCAQAIGARSGGRAVGTVGAAAALSFYPTKNLGAMGDGGAVATPSPEVDRKARALRNYGQSARYVHDESGLNSRLDEIHAAILSTALLPRLEAWTGRRRAIAARYREALRGAAVDLPPVPEGSESVWHLFPVLVDDGRRDDFMQHLRTRQIEAGVHYPVLIPDQRALRQYGRWEVRGGLSRARRYAAGEVSLPIHPHLSDDDVGRVIEAVRDWRCGC